MDVALDLKGAIASALAPYGALDLSNPVALIRNLVFVYHTMRASEHLLEVAIGQSKGSLRDYFVEHLEEERQHETWLAADLATVGIDAKNTPIPRQAVELVGSQYYLIYHLDPAALLGYMALMECFSTPIEQLEVLEAIHGKPLLRCLRYHAEHDLDHGDELLKVFEKLEPRQQAIAIESGVQAAHYFGTAMLAFSVNSKQHQEPREWH